MHNKRNLIEESIIEIEGQQVKLRKFKQKTNNKRPGNARSNTITCPDCMSVMKLDEAGVWYCTSDRLKLWEKEFNAFYKLDPKKKTAYLSKLSNIDKFKDLYHRWEYALNNAAPEEFSCSYTNNVFLPIASNEVQIPDPLFVKVLEEKLNRKLTEEELAGEEKLYYSKGSVTDKWNENCREIKIPYVSIPSETTSYPW